MILLFFMEETNFNRKVVTGMTPGEEYVEATTSTDKPLTEGVLDEGKAPAGQGIDATEIQTQVTPHSNKTFLQKMKVIRKEDLQNSAKLKGLVLRPLIYVSFPIIFFSGFMYGAIVCYFNVLNGTSSLILSKPPYNFSSSMVGLSYVSCLIGVFIG